MANRNYPKNSTATTVIPFDNPVTAIPQKTITGAVTFSKVTTGAQVGYGALIRVVANGSNIPDLSAFKKIGSGTYDNTNGVVNQLWFIYDGVDYCVSITQPVTISGGGGGDTTPPSTTSVSVENAEPNKVLIAYGETLDSGSVPATSAYTVKVNGTTRTTSSVAITGANVKVTFGGAAVISTDTITLDYVVPGSNPVQDVAGNDAAALTGVTASNNVGSTGGTFPTTGRVGLWRKADIQQTSGLVSLWPEATGNGIDFAPTPGEEPTFDSDSTVLNAIGKNLKYPAGMATTAAYTAYFRVKKTGNDCELLGDTSGYSLLMEAADVITRPDPTGGFQTNGTAIANMTSYKVLCIVVHGGTTPSELYIDGTVSGSFDSNALGTSRNFERLCGENGYQFKGNIECWAVFNGAHTSSEVATNSPLLATA
jgi:hypothetical protein